MVPFCYQPLAAAAGWALPAAVVAPLCLPAATAWAAVGVLVALGWRHRLRHAGLAALPTVLAAMPLPLPAQAAVRPGPVAVQGTVAYVVRTPSTGQTHVYLQPHRRSRCVVFNRDIELRAGDRIQVLARQGAPAIPGLRPTLRGVAATLRHWPGPWSLGRARARLRRAMEQQLLRLVPGEHGAMLATLVLGRATRPNRELAAAHRATGLSHLLAVSGAHAAMLAFLLGLSSRGRRLGAGRLRTWTVLAVLVTYGAVAGAEPPVLRAVVAFVLAACAARLGRPFGIATGLLAPALVTCLVEPQALTGPSFLLSYAAVIGLALALRGHDPRERGAMAWLSSALYASWWATLLTAPLTLWFFGQLAPWTILLTPLCAPLVAAMLLLGLLAASAGQLAPIVADAFAWPLRLLAHGYASIVHTADHLPGTPIPAWFVPPTWALTIAGLCGVGLVLWRPSRRSIAWSAILLVVPWFLPLRPQPAPSFTLFAVGHGQAALACTAHGHRIVIDCGSLQGGFRAARAIDEAMLARRIDLLVVTHADEDHHNGLATLLTRIRVSTAMVPVALADSEVPRLLGQHGVAVDLLQPGDHVHALPDVEVLAPPLPASAGDNNQSLWVRTRIGAADVLLSGDAQELGIAAAIAAGFAQPSAVLVLPHHGRKNTNAPHLLARVRPRACLASASATDGETALGPLARRFGADLWSTGAHGSITLTGDPTVITATLGHRGLP